MMDVNHEFKGAKEESVQNDFSPIVVRCVPWCFHGRAHGAGEPKRLRIGKNKQGATLWQNGRPLERGPFEGDSARTFLPCTGLDYEVSRRLAFHPLELLMSRKQSQENSRQKSQESSQTSSPKSRLTGQSRVKTLQLCRQVQRTVQAALGCFDDEVLQSLHVREVTPIGGAGQLLVRLGPMLPDDPLEPVEVLAAMERHSGRLRTEVAQSINRRKAPVLTFQYAPGE